MLSYIRMGSHKIKQVSPRVNVDELEQEQLLQWENENTFEASLRATEDNPLFTFYDGPPYATGKPHYGHILQSAIKDTVLRYKTMQGYHVPRRVGWDCHGLPVETLVEKELGFTNKKDIEAYGIKEFNERCRETVFRYIDEFTATLKRMGRWADYDNAYATLDNSYIESEWWVFKQLWDQELVYKDFRSTPYCIRCATPLSNFEVSSNYADRTDQAVYVLLPIVGRENYYLLIWTTTPWTLPANVAVAYSLDESVEYVAVSHEEKKIVLAKDRVTAVFGESAEVSDSISREELAQWRYTPPYPDVAGALEEDLSEDSLYRLVPGDHVTVTDGSGLVHMAPAFGEEDMLVGKAHELPVLRTIGSDGTFLPEVPQWGGQNLFDANPRIAGDLQARGILLKEEQYTHSYPFCWRCDEPLIYYALDTWFVKVTDMKEALLKNNQQVHWIPDHVKEGRFAKGIESAPDWAVSRNRFWSVPMPVWQCEACTQRLSFGSIAELAEAAGISPNAITDLHRPFVDEITWDCGSCQDGTMRRVEEVLDVWFDSGSMPYAQWHYPFENKEFVERGFPADFIAESIEMTRAWFYVLHVLATGLTVQDRGLGTSTPAYKNVIASGLIFAEDGRKLSKKLKNYPEPEPTIVKYGADTVRMYLLSSTALGEPYRFSEKDLTQLHRSVYLTLWNVYSFFTRYARVHAFTPDHNPTPSDAPLDVWLLSRLREVERDVLAAMDEYRIDQAARLVLPFIDDLSNWYVRRSRARFQPAAQRSTEDTTAALQTLHTTLVRLTQLIAPFMPFVSDTMYRNLTGDQSVHLKHLPTRAQAHKAVTADDERHLAAMIQVRQLVREGLALRAKAALKVRQPLSEIVISGPKEALAGSLEDILRDEINVKEVRYSVSLPTDPRYLAGEKHQGLTVAINTELTEPLKQEGAAREIIRHIQQLRRLAGFELNDNIHLHLASDSKFIQSAIAAHQETITKAVQATLVDTIDNPDKSQTVSISKESLAIAVVKKS